MLRNVFFSLFILLFSASASALTFQIYCPEYQENKKKFLSVITYNNQNIFVDTIGNKKKINPRYYRTNNSGIVKIPKKIAKLYMQPGTKVRVYLTFPNSKTITSACTTLAMKVYKNKNNIFTFKGSGLTEDCGIVDKICSPKTK